MATTSQRTVTYYVDDELLAEFKEYCFDRNISQAEAWRRAIRFMIDYSEVADLSAVKLDLIDATEDLQQIISTIQIDG